MPTTVDLPSAVFVETKLGNLTRSLRYCRRIDQCPNVDLHFRAGAAPAPSVKTDTRKLTECLSCRGTTERPTVATWGAGGTGPTWRFMYSSPSATPSPGP